MYLYFYLKISVSFEVKRCTISVLKLPYPTPYTSIQCPARVPLPYRPAPIPTAATWFWMLPSTYHTETQKHTHTHIPCSSLGYNNRRRSWAYSAFCRASTAVCCADRPQMGPSSQRDDEQDLQGVPSTWWCVPLCCAQWQKYGQRSYTPSQAHTHTQHKQTNTLWISWEMNSIPSRLFVSVCQAVFIIGRCYCYWLLACWCPV